jgi:hypothetical protein
MRLCGQQAHHHLLHLLQVEVPLLIGKLRGKLLEGFNMADVCNVTPHKKDSKRCIFNLYSIANFVAS